MKIGTEASADAWSNPTSIMFGLLAVAATAFLGAVFLTGMPGASTHPTWSPTSGGAGC